jgi:hypothetical protein
MNEKIVKERLDLNEEKKKKTGNVALIESSNRAS